MKKALSWIVAIFMLAGTSVADVVIFEDDFEDGTLEPWVLVNDFGEVTMHEGDYALEVWGYWNDTGIFGVPLGTMPEVWTIEFDVYPRDTMTQFNNVYMGMSEGMPWAGGAYDWSNMFYLQQEDLDILYTRWELDHQEQVPIPDFGFREHVVRMERNYGDWEITWDVGGPNERVIYGFDNFSTLDDLYLWVGAGPYYESENGAHFDNFVVTTYYPTITVDPVGNTTIPARGGALNFVGMIQNGATPLVTTAWASVTLPNGNSYGPLVAFQNLNLPAEYQVQFQGIQFVPNFAPGGEYQFHTMLGTLPNTVIAEDSFQFNKVGRNNELAVHDRGWDFEADLSDSGELTEPVQPETFTMSQAYPNPFNSTVGVSVVLPASGQLSIAVYDVTGRLVETLARDMFTAGEHRLSWSPSNLASGVYFIQAALNGSGRQMQKIVYVK